MNFLLILTALILTNSSDFILFSQSDTLRYVQPKNMPLSKKILWGENGIIRKMNLAPNSRSDELKLRHKMLKTHQKLGFATIAILSYQIYLPDRKFV